MTPMYIAMKSLELQKLLLSENMSLRQKAIVQTVCTKLASLQGDSPAQYWQAVEDLAFIKEKSAVVKPLKRQTWVDIKTGLEWTYRCSDLCTRHIAGFESFNNILKTCEAYDRNYRNWRLPATEELVALIGSESTNILHSPESRDVLYWNVSGNFVDRHGQEVEYCQGLSGYIRLVRNT